jgi:ubiquinone/menaquinone biosynthesis C-methylase UbiE
MLSKIHKELLNSILISPIYVDSNFAVSKSSSAFKNQSQTNDAFSEKWEKYDSITDREKLYQFQKDWYLKLYGFDNEKSLQDYLQSCEIILDAGCGLGYKAAWFAKLAPNALVIGIDFSTAYLQAAKLYQDIPNLFFINGDIAVTEFKDSVISYVSCDQVIMHTEIPEKTFSELARITDKNRGQFACYFYAKKALPRELLDDYFRTACMSLTNQELWAMSEQLTELGRCLSELNIEIDAPSIPMLGITGGKYDLQRFIYWNFLKCFWNAELGKKTSIATNFDWYSPSNAKRFSKSEILKIVEINQLSPIFFHQEEACFSGRFIHAINL